MLLVLEPCLVELITCRRVGERIDFYTVFVTAPRAQLEKTCSLLIESLNSTSCMIKLTCIHELQLWLMDIFSILEKWSLFCYLSFHEQINSVFPPA